MLSKSEDGATLIGVTDRLRRAVCFRVLAMTHCNTRCIEIHDFIIFSMMLDGLCRSHGYGRASNGPLPAQNDRIGLSQQVNMSPDMFFEYKHQLNRSCSQATLF